MLKEGFIKSKAHSWVELVEMPHFKGNGTRSLINCLRYFNRPNSPSCFGVILFKYFYLLIQRMVSINVEPNLYIRQHSSYFYHTFFSLTVFFPPQNQQCGDDKQLSFWHCILENREESS